MKKTLYLIFIIFICVGCDNVKCPKNTEKIGSECFNIEYSKATEVIGCDGGYELINNQCIKKETRSADYNTSCPSGYTLYSDIGCAIIEDRGPLYRWVCKGENLYVDGTLCMTISNATNKMSLYRCPVGTTISGGCQSAYVDGETLYSCNSQPSCISYSSYKMTFTAQTQTAVYLQCVMQSGSPDGTTCNITKYESSTFVKYGCPIGYLLVNDMCFKTTYVKGAEQEFYCPVGYELTSGRGCRKITKANKIKNYYCNNNEILEGSNCITETKTGTKLIYKCENAKSVLDINNSCVIKTKVEPIRKD